MPSLDELKALLGEETKDLRLNLANVLDNGDLELQERYAIAFASALFIKDTELAEAIKAQGAGQLTDDAAADAKPARNARFAVRHKQRK